MTWLAFAVIGLVILSCAGFAWGSQVAEWTRAKVLARLSRDADSPEIDEDWAAKNLQDPDA